MKSKYDNSRRRFLKNSLLTGALFPLMPRDLLSLTKANIENSLKINIFSKHLQFLGYTDMAEAAAEMGFDGVDVSVRPNGHVLPEKVETDLPRWSKR